MPPRPSGATLTTDDEQEHIASGCYEDDAGPLSRGECVSHEQEDEVTECEVIAKLYGVADDAETAVLDDLTIRAGFVWRWVRGRARRGSGGRRLSRRLDPGRCSSAPELPPSALWARPDCSAAIPKPTESPVTFTAAPTWAGEAHAPTGRLLAYLWTRDGGLVNLTIMRED